MKRLREVRRPLANFFASGVFELREKLGPILWQLPPNMRFEPATLDAFLGMLPADTTAAEALARSRDWRLKGRARLRFRGPERRLRHALEVRHASFATEALPALLRRHNVALVVSDTPRLWPRLEELTADFMYLRLHGATRLYGSGYGRAAINAWAERIAAWRRGRELTRGEAADRRRGPPPVARDVYCYFDNTDVKLRAPLDARALMARCGNRGPPELPDRPTA